MMAPKIRRFLLSDSGSIEDAFKFSLITFIVEMFISAYICFSVLAYTRGGNLISANNLVVFSTGAFFFFRVFLIHLLFGCILRGLELVFSVRRRGLQYFLWLSYACLFIAVKYPQVYDEMPWVSLALKNLRLFDVPWVRWIPAFALILGYIWSFYKESQKTLGAYIASSVSMILIIFYFTSWQTLDPDVKTISNPAISKHTQKPKIIFITVDSLKGDSQLQNNSYASESLQKYLSKSTHFKRVISPIAQTHAALSAIFSSLNPTTTGVRSNLSKEATDTDGMLVNTPISIFKQNGYKIKFMSDAMEYSNVTAGNIFDEVDAPDYAVANLILSTFFKNRIFYGLFNNPIGKFFVPEIYRNSTFFYSYDLPDFTNRVLSELNQVSEADSPELLFIHTCSLHWPAILPYPYYPQSSFPEHVKVPFSYKEKHGAAAQDLTIEQWKTQARFNRTIYESGVNFTIKKFLNPVIDQIERSRIGENAIIVLMSDHGENLWDTEAKLPKNKFVEHGGSLIFGSSAELAYFRILYPQIKQKYYDKNIGTIDIIPTILKLAGLSTVSSDGRDVLEDSMKKNDDAVYYAETGILPFGNFAGQFMTTPISGLAGLFRFDPKAYRIYANPQLLPTVLQQKQRAVYYKDFRYTVFPALTGLEEFLCNVEADPECLVNLKSTEVEIYMHLRKSMSEYLQKDINAGNLKIGVCSIFPELSSTMGSMEQIAIFQWQYFFQALECLHGFHDYGYALSIFEKLEADKDSSELLKRDILSQTLLLCAYENIFTNENSLPDFLNKYISHINLDEILPGHRMHASKCLKALGKEKDAEMLNSVLKRDIEMDPMDPAFSVQAENLLAEVKSISQTFSYSPLLVKEKIDDYFRVELGYNLVSEMSFLLFESMSPHLKSDSDESLLLAAKMLFEGNSLGTGFFNYIIRKVDTLEVPGFEANQVSNLKAATLANRTFDRPVENVKQKEIFLSIKKIKTRLCTNDTQLCRSALKFLNKLSSETALTN